MDTEKVSYRKERSSGRESECGTSNHDNDKMGGFERNAKMVALGHNLNEW